MDPIRNRRRRDPDPDPGARGGRDSRRLGIAAAALLGLGAFGAAATEPPTWNATERSSSTPGIRAHPTPPSRIERARARSCGCTAAERLDPSAREHVLVADLRALGLADYGDPTDLGRRPELFFDDEPMPLARWPNEGFVTITDVAETGLFVTQVSCVTKLLPVS